jgi:predicted outer membrane repeat protein
MYLNTIYSNSSGCNFIQNNASDKGGAICVRMKSTYSYSPNCLFKENNAK